MQIPNLSEGDIRIPFDCPARYRWWDDRIAGKLSLKEIRAELMTEKQKETDNANK